MELRGGSEAFFAQLEKEVRRNDQLERENTQYQNKVKDLEKKCSDSKTREDQSKTRERQFKTRERQGKIRERQLLRELSEADGTEGIIAGTYKDIEGKKTSIGEQSSEDRIKHLEKECLDGKTQQLEILEKLEALSVPDKTKKHIAGKSADMEGKKTSAGEQSSQDRILQLEKICSDGKVRKDQLLEELKVLSVADKVKGNIAEPSKVVDKKKTASGEKPPSGG